MLPENFTSIALLGDESSKVDSLLRVILGKDIEKNDFTESDVRNLIYNFQIKSKRFTVQKINIQALPEESIKVYNNSNILITYFTLQETQQFDTDIKNQILMANTFGVKNVIVILDSSNINLKDTSKFLKTRTKIQELFTNRNFNINNIQIIDSVQSNDQLKERIVSILVPDKNRERNKVKKIEKKKNLLLSISNVFKVDKNHIGINGKIISGELNVEKDIHILPLNQKFKVLEIQKMHKTIKTANVGDDIGFLVKTKNSLITEGMIVTDNVDSVKQTRNVQIQVINLNGMLISLDKTYTLLCHNVETLATVNNIVLSKKQGKETTKINVNSLLLGEKGILNVSFREPIIMAPYNNSNEIANKHLSSVAILHNTTRELIGIGIVKSVKYK